MLYFLTFSIIQDATGKAMSFPEDFQSDWQDADTIVGSFAGPTETEEVVSTCLQSNLLYLNIL
jgi:hypothetical protein